jgi:multiple sugar transport system substrate-binding protein
MTSRRLTRAIAGSVAALALLVGVPGPAAAQTLRFVSWQVDEKGYGDWWQAAIDEFERTHEGVTIEFTKVPRDSFADQMTTLFASGSPPDIVHLASFEFQSFADNGWLENLDPWIAESDLDLEGWAAQGKCQWNGETVCIMLLYFGYVMAYNQEMLEEAGVALPSNWEEFHEAAKALTKDADGDGLIDQYGVGISTAAGSGQYLSEMLNFVLDAGAYWTTDEGEPAFDTPEMAEGLARWKTLIKEGLTPVDLPAGDVRQLLIEGKTAMRLDGPWIYGVMQQASPEMQEKLKLVAPPFHPPVGGSSNVITMPSELDDDRKQLVWEFIELVTSEEWQRKFAELGASPSPRPGAVPEGITEVVPHFDLLLETMKEADQAGVDRIPTGYEVEFNEFAKLITEETQRMIIEDLDPADAAARIQERAQELK